MRKLQYVTDERPSLRIFTVEPTGTFNNKSVPTELEESNLSELLQEMEEDAIYLREIGIKPPIVNLFSFHLLNRNVVAVILTFGNKAKAIVCSSRQLAKQALQAQLKLNTI